MTILSTTSLESNKRVKIYFNGALQASLWVRNGAFLRNEPAFAGLGFRLGSGTWIFEHTRYTISIMFCIFRNPYVLRIISLL